jgi:hypothetical protein
VVDLQRVLRATAINEGQRVVLVQRGGAGSDGRLGSREERDFGEHLLTERAFEQLAQKEALSDAVVRAGEASTL